MKLSTQQIAAIKQQTDADPVAEDHPAAGQLREAFGDHTFYVDRNGLHVFEPLEAPENGGGKPAALVQLAAWTDEDMTSLAPQEPQVGPVVVDLENENGAGNGAGDDETPGGGSAA